VRDEDGRPLLSDRDPEGLAQLLQQAVSIGIRFTTGELRDGLVLRYADVPELVERFGSPLPEKGVGDSQLLSQLEKIACWSVAQADPRYLAFPDLGSSVAGALADVVSLFLNQNLIAFDRSAPAASVIEAQLILWLRELVGYESAPLTQYRGLATLGGMWSSGGNMSNHVAMAVSLAKTWPEVRSKGLQAIHGRPVVVLARGVEHFSYLGAAQVLGLGADGLVWATPSSDYTSDCDAIARALDQLPVGDRPFMVVGVAGNCRTTGIDDLATLADLCHERKVWFHVDACHGGSLLFSRELRSRLTGIERADSVSLDPHKGLFVGYPSSYVLFKDPTDLGRFARYPEKAEDPTCLDLGLITPFYGSRGFQSLRLWALINHLGRAGIAALVEQRQQSFMEMVALLEGTGCFVIIGRSDFYRCAFVFCPEGLRSRLASLARDPGRHDALRAVISRYTTEFCERLYRSGRVAFDLFALQDLGNTLGLGDHSKYQVMGMCIGHPRIDAWVKADIHNDIVAPAQDLVEPMSCALQALEPNSSAETRGSVPGPAGW
jgi:glutamate/tyrosine decarboxylase-like PLP-dependent enzyme